MRKPYKFVSELSDKDIEFLENSMNNGSTSRIRRRAHAILLSSRGYSIDEISEIYKVQRDTVSKCIDSWEKSGWNGLNDLPKSGRPMKLNSSGIETAKKFIMESPQNPGGIIAKTGGETGIKISLQTLKRIVKKLDMKWKRVRKSIKNKRDEKEFRKMQKEIKSLIRQHRAGKINLFFYDETGFSAGSHVPYAYQPIGKTVEISASCRKRLNVTGFFSPDSELTPFCFECPADSGIAVACFDYFAEHTDKTKKTVVIADNASIHHSYEFNEKIPDWEKKGLFIKYLPSYSPELNHIEILWKSIKYRRLDISAYSSFENLVKNVEDVLKNVGVKHFVEFS